MASCEKKYTILLLSAPIGSGHKLAAQALEQSFALADNVQVVHGSIFDFFTFLFMGTLILSLAV